jgi:hypothetical protein
MYVLPTLGCALLSSTISWASPAPIAGGEVASTQYVNHTNVRREGINCHVSGLADCTYWGGTGSLGQALADLFQYLPDDLWYPNQVQIGASFYIESPVGHCDLIFFRHSLHGG